MMDPHQAPFVAPLAEPISPPTPQTNHVDAAFANGSSAIMQAWLADSPPWLSDPIAFFRCWRHQDCGGCVTEADERCGWCAVSSACLPLPPAVPSASSEARPLLSPPPLPLPRILLPLRYPNICPQQTERYELRAAPLHCRVSTATVLGAGVGVGAVLGAQLAVFALCVILGALLRAWKGSKGGWWRVWRYRVRLVGVRSRRDGDERESALGDGDRTNLTSADDEESRWTARPRGWTPRAWRAYRDED